MKNKRITRKDYENYLNDIFPQYSEKNYNNRLIKNFGSWIRKNDPIKFNVGYSEYLLIKG